MCEQVVHHIAFLRLCTQPLTYEVQQRGGGCGCIQVLGVECFFFVYKGGVAVGGSGERDAADNNFKTISADLKVYFFIFVI
jgi:hypothetical protein